MAIRAITFDFWSTLFRDANGPPRQAIRIDAFTKASGLPRGTVVRALEQTWHAVNRHHIEKQRTLGPDDAVRIAMDLLGMGHDSMNVADMAEIFGTAIIRHSPVPIEDSVEAVRAAADRLPIALISDTGVSPGRSLRVLMDRHGFTEHFGTLVFSDEVGVAKPQPLMFERAAAALGVGADELLHIGDLEPTDIAGAQAIGSKAALFTGFNDRFRDSTCADYVFESWREFIDILPNLN